MPPIDANIPLQVQPLKIPTAQEVMSLRDLATRSQINEVTLQEKQMELGKRNALLQLMKDPTVSDPQTGRLTPQGIAKISQIDPEKGIALGRQQQTLSLQDIAVSDKKDALRKEIGTSYVTAYQNYLQSTGGNTQEAERLARQDTLKSIDERESSGAFTARGIPKQDIDKLRQLPSPEQMRTMVTALGGSIPREESPFQKELRSAGVMPGTPEYDKAMKAKVAKDTAPPQTLLMMSGQLDIPPETAKFVAQQYLSGDKAAAQGFARNARARSQIATAITEEAKAQGMTAKDAANAMAEFEGQKAGQRTLGTRQAQIELAANVTKQFAPIAIAASEKYGRSDIKSVNDLQKAVQSRAASPELRQFNFANLSLINAYARAINPQGVGNESDKAHAREVLDTGFSKGDYKAAVAQLQTEIDAELKAPGAVKKGMKEFFTGKKGEEPKGNAPQAALDYLKAHPETADHFKAKYGYLP